MKLISINVELEAGIDHNCIVMQIRSNVWVEAAMRDKNLKKEVVEQLEEILIRIKKDQYKFREDK